MLADLTDWTVIGLFVLAAAAIGVVGTRMVAIADRIADRTGMGETIAGGILLGMSTSLSGVVSAVTAAAEGQPSLSFATAIGGIPAQTAFLVIADLAHRRVNLEHAAADANNLLQAAALVVLLSLPVAAFLMPAGTVLGVHPVSVILVAVYIFATKAAFTMKDRPMWRPEETTDTRYDEPDRESERAALTPLLMQCVVLVAILAVSGYTVAATGAALSSRFGISQTLVGALLMAVVTSIPELVTTVAAVRRGALQLAVGGIIGGNTFDILFLSASDVAYREGSLYHAIGEGDLLLAVGAILMTGVLLMGLVMRERRGVGFEGTAILAIYAAIVGAQVLFF